MKMAESADTEIKDLPTLNILMCYLLYKIGTPVQTEQLYDIAVSTGLVNYFYYQDSLAYLMGNGCIAVKKDSDGTECYVLQSNGFECAKELKNYVPKAYRDNLVLAALRYFSRIKHEKEVTVEYIEKANGCYTRVVCHDSKCDLMDLYLYAPDMAQAKMLGRKIMLNPSGFYSKVMNLALFNEETEYDLTDN